MFPTFYNTTGVIPTATAPTGPDATMDFQQALNDPKRWVIKQGVPLFKCHERVDPNTQKLIRVDVPKLYRIAQNMQRLERAGVPVRMTLGHTEPNKPETNQPPVSGYYRNARVQTFGPMQEPAVVADEWLDPNYQPARKNFPYRSAEYFDDSEQITGVALLTRDPYLELGVVAYTRAGAQAVHYSRVGEQPATKYHYLLGDAVMWPQVPAGPNAHLSATGQPVAPQPGMVDAYGQPIPTPFDGYTPSYPVPQPVPYAYPQPQYAAPPPPPRPAPAPAPVPAGYAYPAPPVGYGSRPMWSGSYSRPSMHRSHPSGGAVYANQPRGGRRGYYANDPVDDDMDGGGGMPPDIGGGGMGPEMGGPPPGMGPPMGGGGDVMSQVADLISQAAALIASEAGGGGGMAPTEPFPGGGGGGPPTMSARYANPRGRQRPPQRQQQRPPQRYQRDGSPLPPNPNQPRTTISGLPVGYQMELQKINYENQQLRQAMNVLFYERDASDTQACISEIEKLAAMGYNVGEYEVDELKAKPTPQERGLYIQHILTKYERVGTDMAPTMPGDPTPGPMPGQGGYQPLSREGMQAALRMGGAGGPNEYHRAVEAVRTGQHPQDRLSQYGFGQQPQQQQVNEYGQPFGPAPSNNGHT